MAWATARLKAANDAAASTTTKCAWSANGTSATSLVAATAMTVATATTADPSVVQPTTALTTAAATGNVTITHRQWQDASSNPTTTWVQLTTPVILTTGQTATFQASEMTESIDANDAYTP